MNGELTIVPPDVNIREDLTMITLRKANERGRTHIDWLDSRHSFSFGQYRDPKHPGFRSLRVINDDRVAPGGGFGTHPHRDMEILSLVLEGAMKHRDSMGTGSVIQAGELQKMSAGSGITHSEFNASATEPVHFYQIWIEPERRGIEPEYAQIALNGHRTTPGLHLIAGRHAPEDAINIHQDVQLYLGNLKANTTLLHDIPEGRHVWIQMISGKITSGNLDLAEGDGLAVSDETGIELRSTTDAQFLLFDLA